MHLLPPSERRTARRLLPAVTAALVSTALAAPVAGAQSPITVDAAKDSVQVSGLPLGMATLQITRPDLKTGKPVVTGQYQGLALLGLPFGVNTTAPTLFNPAGDCWQKGALSLTGDLGLTPDILPGDTVSVVGGPTLTVPAQTSAGDGTLGGPITGCDTLSLWGRNEVKTADFASPGGDLAVAGHAQPGTKNVTVTATDANDVSTDAGRRDARRRRLVYRDHPGRRARAAGRRLAERRRGLHRPGCGDRCRGRHRRPDAQRRQGDARGGRARARARGLPRRRLAPAARRSACTAC